DELRGYRLLKAARLSTSERQNVLTQTANSTHYHQVRLALRTLFSDDVEASQQQPHERRRTAWMLEEDCGPEAYAMEDGYEELDWQQHDWSPVSWDDGYEPTYWQDWSDPWVELDWQDEAWPDDFEPDATSEKEEASAVQLEALSSGHLTIDLAAEASPVTSAKELLAQRLKDLRQIRSREHGQDPSREDSIGMCGLRTTYVVKKAGHGQTRQMGPDPQIIRLALSSLEKNTRPEEMSADVVNGKIMEIKGTMLQMGLKTPMALNLTLKEYEDRLEKFGRADGKP
ncbi:unnamed protein product, partial [Durusdinium trenchii]